MYKKERNPWDRDFVEIVLVVAAIFIVVFIATGWWRIVFALLTGETTLWAVVVNTPPVTGILSAKTVEGLWWIVLGLVPVIGWVANKAIEWEYSRL